MNSVTSELKRLFFRTMQSAYIFLRRTAQKSTLGVEARSFEFIHHSVAFNTTNGGKITIGDNCQIEQGVILATFGGEIVIGDNVFIGPYCVIYGHGGVDIGSQSMIAAQSILVSANHQFNTPSEPIHGQGITKVGIKIGQGCWIGAAVQVLDGVTVAPYSVIGAGSVVPKSILNSSLCFGNPCRVIRPLEGNT